MAYIKDANNTLAHNILVADFEKFLQELHFDKFDEFKKQIIISTMHKAKGKEFDIVFVGVDDSKCEGKLSPYHERIIKAENPSDLDFELAKKKFLESAEKRLLYVAFSRAKQQLFIHTQRDDLVCLSGHFSECKTCDTKEADPHKKCYEMGLGDIWLDFRKPQDNLKVLHIVAGDICQIETRETNGKKYIDILYEQKCVGSLEKELTQKILEDKDERHYKLKEAIVKYIVKWRDRTGEMTTQVLCEIYLEKN